MVEKIKNAEGFIIICHDKASKFEASVLNFRLYETGKKPLGVFLKTLP